MFITILLFILILGVLIFVHELGHFVTARRNGIKASEFGFGFPPRIIGIQLMKSGKKKWRIIWGNRDGDDETEEKDLEYAHKNHIAGGTIYSLNWIPLGGFVKIKGENGENENDPDSFVAKSAWKRIKVLSAGVIMNFLLAWFLISIVLMIGAPETIDSDAADKNADFKIQISQVSLNSPASAMGLKIGDEILKTQIDKAGNIIELRNIKEVQDYINSKKGERIKLKISRAGRVMELDGMPRKDVPENEGALGVSLAEVTMVKYVWYAAIWKGLQSVWDLTLAIIFGLLGIIKSLFMGKGAGVDVSGPVGIAILTRDVASMGLVYVLQFTAILSVNLGIINALPIPALDGGRILFILIEKIKGSPINQKVEHILHTAFFIVLIMLMALVTFNDISKFF